MQEEEELIEFCVGEWVSPFTRNRIFQRVNCSFSYMVPIPPRDSYIRAHDDSLLYPRSNIKLTFACFFHVQDIQEGV